MIVTRFARNTRRGTAYSYKLAHEFNASLAIVTKDAAHLVLDARPARRVSAILHGAAQSEAGGRVVGFSETEVAAAVQAVESPAGNALRWEELVRLGAGIPLPEQERPRGRSPR